MSQYAWQGCTACMQSHSLFMNRMISAGKVWFPVAIGAAEWFIVNVPCRLRFTTVGIHAMTCAALGNLLLLASTGPACSACGLAAAADYPARWTGICHDLVMLGDLLASLLAADVSRHQAGTSGSSSRSWMQTIGSSGAAGGGSGAAFLTPEAALRQSQGLSAAQQRVVLFMLQCLQLLPVPVASSVAGDVLLRPLGHVMGWEPEVVHWALLVAAVAAEVPAAASTPRVGTQAAAVTASLKAVAAKGRVAGARQRLHALGFTQLGVAAWQDDCLGSIAWQAAAQQQHRRQQEALKAAAVAVPDTAAAGSSGGAAGGAGMRDAEKLPQAHGTTADGTDITAVAGGTVTAAAELEGPSGVHNTAAVAVDRTDTTDGPLSTAEAAAVAVPAPPETAVPCDDADSADGALVDNMGTVAASSPAEDEAATVATAEPDSSLIPGASVDEPSIAKVDHEVEELAVVTASGGSVLGDLSEIADPCQRQIEEHRRLRGIGMNLRGEVRRAGWGLAGQIILCVVPMVTSGKDWGCCATVFQLQLSHTIERCACTP